MTFAAGNNVTVDEQSMTSSVNTDRDLSENSESYEQIYIDEPEKKKTRGMGEASEIKADLDDNDPFAKIQNEVGEELTLPKKIKKKGKSTFSKPAP